MQYFTKILMVLVLTGFISCGDTTLNEDKEDIVEIPSYTNMIAATIVTDINGNNQYDHKLLLIDYDNPENYEIALKESISPMFPKFSLDGSKLFFLDSQIYPINVESGFWTLDLNSGMVVSPYPQNNFYLDKDMDFCWKPDGSGLFISAREWDETLLNYDLNEREGNYVQIFNYIRPIAHYSPDQLVGFAKDGLGSDAIYGYYILDSELNVIEKLDNPHLINNGIYSHGWVWDLDYNNDFGLFAYSIRRQGVAGYIIAITNKEGSLYQELTSGEYIDTKPVWGPDGDTVLFLRSPGGYYVDGITHRLMKVTISTGVIEEVFNFENVEGAVGFSEMDFAAY